MEPLTGFCLAALLFLSLPLPLFASAALDACPGARRSLTPWVWANSISGAVTGLLMIATPLHPVIALTVAAAVFVYCGSQFSARLARSAACDATAD